MRFVLFNIIAKEGPKLDEAMNINLLVRNLIKYATNPDFNLREVKDSTSKTL